MRGLSGHDIKGFNIERRSRHTRTGAVRDAVVSIAGQSDQEKEPSEGDDVERKRGPNDEELQKRMEPKYEESEFQRWLAIRDEIKMDEIDNMLDTGVAEDDTQGSSRRNCCKANRSSPSDTVSQDDADKCDKLILYDLEHTNVKARLAKGDYLLQDKSGEDAIIVAYNNVDFPTVRPAAQICVASIVLTYFVNQYKRTILFRRATWTRMNDIQLGERTRYLGKATTGTQSHIP